MNPIIQNLPLAQDADQISFKLAMRHLVGGVIVITVGSGGDIAGMAASSVSSLSTGPPSVIVGGNRQSSTWQLLKRDGTFDINILRGDQLDVAERLSGVGD